MIHIVHDLLACDWSKAVRRCVSIWSVWSGKAYILYHEYEYKYMCWILRGCVIYMISFLCARRRQALASLLVDSYGVAWFIWFRFCVWDVVRRWLRYWSIVNIACIVGVCCLLWLLVSLRGAFSVYVMPSVEFCRHARSGMLFIGLFTLIIEWWFVDLVLSWYYVWRHRTQAVLLVDSYMAFIVWFL